MKKVVVAVDIARLNSRFHKHHRKDGWFNVYFYRNGKKTQAKLGEDVKEENLVECSSFKSFRDDTFYKCQSLSKNDPLFDYYKIKKREIDNRIKNFAKERERGKKTHKIDNKFENVEIKKGKFILEF